MRVIGSAGAEASYLTRPRHLRQHHVRAERKADIAEGRFAQRQAEDPFLATPAGSIGREKNTTKRVRWTERHLPNCFPTTTSMSLSVAVRIVLHRPKNR
jgi:hypothetical protein